MRYKRIVMMLAVSLSLVTAGCGSNQIQVEITPTPAATPTPTPAPATPTPTPLPTATPAPRLIGTKTADSKCIYLTNNTQKVLRKLYLKVSGAEDWGRSLIPNESTVRSTEQVRMYYTPQQGDGITYDMRFVDGDGSTYEIYSVNLSDMERASLKKDEEQGIYYLSYMSVSQKSEKDTKDNYTNSYGYGGDSDIEYYDDYSNWDESYYEESYYDESYYDESYYDESSDDSDYYYDYDEDDGSYDNSDGEIVWDEDGDWN